MEPWEKEEFYQSTSRKYQWLPSEFRVSDEGKVTINSYINNLHPIKDKGLYSTIASIFEKFIPLVNKVLTDLATPRPHRIRPSRDWIMHQQSDSAANSQEDPDRPHRKVETTCIPQVPTEVKDVVRKSIDVRGCNLQVIVKLANIELKAGEYYPGGTWHVEGMENEHIVASGIYYYSSDNIGDSDLAFRTAVSEPTFRWQDQVTAKLYGLYDGKELMQELGMVVTQQGRCIAFPNIYQHEVQEFNTNDLTLPGYRKILVFFLVDPYHKIPSTATIGPQQQSWFLDKLVTIPPFNKLPREIVEKIVQFSKRDDKILPKKDKKDEDSNNDDEEDEEDEGDNASPRRQIPGLIDIREKNDSEDDENKENDKKAEEQNPSSEEEYDTMTLEEAKGYRAELMKERKFFVNETSEVLFSRPFSFCEH